MDLGTSSEARDLDFGNSMLNRFIAYFKGMKHAFRSFVKVACGQNLDKGACLSPANYAKLQVNRPLCLV